MNINNQQVNQRTIFRWLASHVTLGCQVADVTHGCQAAKVTPGYRVAKVTFSMSTLIAVLFTNTFILMSKGGPIDRQNFQFDFPLSLSLSQIICMRLSIPFITITLDFHL